MTSNEFNGKNFNANLDEAQYRISWRARVENLKGPGVEKSWT